jgi:hypothetical protein
MTTAPISGFNPSALAASMAAIAGAGTTAAPAKEKATVYIAVGVLRDGVDIDAEGFDPSKDLINLPQMQGLDNMKPDERKAGTVAFATEQQESNDLLADLKEQALASMQPGERKIIPFYVTVYKVKEPVVAEAPAAPRTPRKFL